MAIHNFIQRYGNATWTGLKMPLQLAWRHRDLLHLLVKRDIVTRTSGTVLGHLWLLLQPALQVIGFWFLLDVVLQIKFPNNVPFLDYFLLGILAWLFISEVLNRSLNVLREFGGLYQRTVFPIAILPLMSLLLPSLLYASVLMIMLFIMYDWTFLPLGLVSIFSLAVWLIPICYILAIIGLFLKDIAQFFPFAISVTLYVTPVMYMPQSLPDSMQWLLYVNPAADIMALLHAMIQGLDWQWSNIVRLVVIWLLLLGPAWVLFRRAEPHIRESL
ncbi:ABC transporter permease [Thioflexithrix psekupsensis]|uniref:ABC transporter permease n=1 Tax=Thioflexithrix psekupsensis TaxID=1570016 RepID=A0A251XBQ9_9GAMM|nr:ABC transporter permease [Thioflexithrix psekupsensis]OUD16166.1 ABC transporter permease [Thioflexithrix psekupsensis]